ncbi:MAG: ArsR family transcriptional regulator [Deltaproteobacteria bacterium]|nr:MAG: ArsR family transcriptional regulator [Deltaproteobacteria bacterium]
MDILACCKAFADMTRARLVNVLHHHELNVGELVAVMGMGQSRISRHLKILSDCGLLVSRRDGLCIFYRTASQGSAGTFLQSVLALMEQDEVLDTDLVQAAEVVRERMTKTRHFFDSIAMTWDRLSREVLGKMDMVQEICSRVPACSAVVDLGCGSGSLLAVLGQKADKVIGVDCSPKMLELAEQRASSDKMPSLRIGELEHLPLRDGETDFGIMSMVLHHIVHPEAAIDEAARILRPGGGLLLVDFGQHDNESMRIQYGDRWLGFTEDAVTTWLDGAGFTLLDLEAFPVNKGLVVNIFKAEKVSA